MFSFSKKKYTVILDIASSSVGAAIVSENKKVPGTPIILFTTREDISFAEENSGADSLTRSLVSTMNLISDSLIDALSVYDVGSQFSLTVLIHAPWATSSTESAFTKLKEGTVINKKIIDTFVKKSFGHIYDSQDSVFDARIINIELNEYATTKPVGSEAQSLKLSVVSSAMHPSVKSAIIQSVATKFPNIDILMLPLQYVLASVAINILDRIEEYTVIDIGGEYISLSVISNGSITKTSSINFGYNYLLRTLSDTDDSKSLQLEKSKMISLIEDTCTVGQCRKIRESLKTEEAEFSRLFGEAISELSKDKKLPSGVLIFTTRFAEEWFKNMIEKIDFANFSKTSKSFLVQNLLEHSDYGSLYKTTKVRRDRRLLLAAQYSFVDKSRFSNLQEDLFMI